jgi:DNA-binding HxlR family transcriptional regulator
MNNLVDERTEWPGSRCSVASALDVVGTRSALLLMREAFMGTRRFDDFAERVGIGEPAAAARLKELVAAGLLERAPYQEPGQRTRYEYQLTEKGTELLPVITALREWGDRWETGDRGPSVLARHRDCGATVHTRLRCEADHEVLAGEIELVPGPGAMVDA